MPVLAGYMWLYGKLPIVCCALHCSCEGSEIVPSGSSDGILGMSWVIWAIRLQDIYFQVLPEKLVGSFQVWKAIQRPWRILAY